MKYVISWFERPQGSPIEYENAQKRILEVFSQWKAPGNFKIEFFVNRVSPLLQCVWQLNRFVGVDDGVVRSWPDGNRLLSQPMEEQAPSF